MSRKRNKRLLFICLGNICRSPAAEGVMRRLVKDSGRDGEITVDSAGIGAWHVGQLPDSRMRRCGARRGYAFDSRARQFSAADFGRFDLIIVMDGDNRRAISSMAQSDDDKAKVHILTEWMTRHKGATSVPDPYYGGESDFDYALDLIEDGCAGLLAAL